MVEAIEMFKASHNKGNPNAVWYTPGKVLNCGGVVVSGLKMVQNSQCLSYTSSLQPRLMPSQRE